MLASGVALNQVLVWCLHLARSHWCRTIARSFTVAHRSARLSFAFPTPNDNRCHPQVSIPLADIIYPQPMESRRWFELQKRTAKSHVRGSLQVQAVLAPVQSYRGCARRAGTHISCAGRRRGEREQRKREREKKTEGKREKEKETVRLLSVCHQTAYFIAPMVFWPAFVCSSLQYLWRFGLHSSQKRIL